MKPQPEIYKGRQIKLGTILKVKLHSGVKLLKKLNVCDSMDVPG